MPTMSAHSPITFAAIDVIGATVVTTWNSDVASSEESSSLPHAAITNARTAAPAMMR